MAVMSNEGYQDILK